MAKLAFPLRGLPCSLARLLPATSIALAVLAPACILKERPPATSTPAPAAAAAPRRFAIERDLFNRMAVRENLPVYWRADDNRDGALDPAEVASLLFYDEHTPARWVDGGKFTPAFEAAFARIVAAVESAKTAPPDERKKLVRMDLDTAMATLIHTDLRGAAEDEKAFVQQMLAVAHAVDALYRKQTGTDVLAPTLPEGDTESRSLFRRNWGPRCVTPPVDKNEACRATVNPVQVFTDVYPASIQKNPKFCAEVEKLPNAKALLEPFTAVREKSGKLEAVSYAEKYKDEMGAVARELHAAAARVTSHSEAPLRAYLEAAAESFTTNDWRPADEAWAKMNATNSKYYVRVAPDETYWEPCSHKAGFHLDFARINPDSLAWQTKLDPLKDEMEKAIATLAGAPYKARKVAFHLPDFIDVIFNAGDSRNAIGATIGQSLPNWGVVASEGRGRTVAMSNLYGDPDNLRIKSDKGSALFTSAVVTGHAWEDKAPGLFSTVLHEAAHNLGPAHEYKVNGKADSAAFGGGLAAMLEELKAQTAALHYVEWLRSRGVIDAALAKKTYVDSLLWALNHIARGMYTDSGQRKAYGQLAAVQIGFFMDAKVMTFDPNAPAANGVDKGAFEVTFEALPAAAEALMKKVAGIKARGDRAAAEALAKRYVDGDVVPQKLIAERALRFPQVNFVYGVDM